MKALLLSLLATSALAADLKPNAKLTFDFPELPNTLAAMVSGTTKVKVCISGNMFEPPIVEKVFRDVLSE
jgi:hypothetical protein